MSFLYREAGRVMKGVEEGRASLKTLTLGRPNNVGGGKGGDENGPKRKVNRWYIFPQLATAFNGCQISGGSIDASRIGRRSLRLWPFLSLILLLPFNLQ